MERRMKKVIAYIISIMLLSTIGLDNLVVKASTILASGACGAVGNEEEVTWTYDSNNVLKISGTGAIADYTDTLMGKAEWNIYKDTVEKIVFEEGITTIGDYAFVDMGENEVVFSDTIVKIKCEAFRGNYNLKNIVLPPYIEYIDDSFSQCSLSGEIVIPGTCDIEGLSVFGSSNFEYITIEEGVENIGYNAFGGMFRRLWLPSTISSLRDDSFFSYNNDPYTPIPVCYGYSDYVKTYAKAKGYIFVDASNEYSLENATASIDLDDIVYDGTEKEPAVAVLYSNGQREIPLYEGYDYTVSYKNNFAVGSAEAVISGKGCYVGEIVKRYNIYGNLENAEVSLSYDTVLYDSNSKEPEVTVNYNKKKLLKDIDYKVTYADNTEEGTAVVTIKGIGNYKGCVQKKFNIYKNDFTKANVKLSYEKVLYDGAAKEPSVTVDFAGYSLKRDTEYTVEFANNVLPGTATVRVIGKGQYTGTVEKQFLIEGLSLENADVKLKESIYSYDGSPKTPPVTVRLGDKTLVKDVDYKLTYEDNVNDGTAYVVITGAGIYTDIVKTSFVILPYNAGMDAVYPDGTLIDGNYVYGVTDDEKNEVELCCPAIAKLTKVQVPATITDENGIVYTVTSIGQKAFYKNTKITNVTIGNTVKSIEDYAFYGCKNISKLTFGKSVEIIGGSAFRKCTKLTTVTLPKSMDELGKNAFYGCSKLKSIVINANTVMDVNSNAIKGISKKAIIKVPKKLVKKYKNKFSKKTGFQSSMKIKKK